MHGNNNAPSVWDVFNEYADVRDDLEDALASFDSVHEEIRTALEDLSGELDDIRARLLWCDSIFKRYRAGKNSIL